MELHYATTNPGKIHTMGVIMQEFNISDYSLEIKQYPIDIPELRSDDVDNCIREIAEGKVSFAYNAFREEFGQSPRIFAVDAGFFVNGMGGHPGPYINFTLDTLGLDGILRAVKGQDRRAHFRHWLAYLDDQLEEPECFCSIVPGILTDEIRGEYDRDTHWSCLSQIFIPDGYEKTEAEMTLEQFNGYASDVHRQQIDGFMKWFLKNRMQQ